MMAGVKEVHSHLMGGKKISARVQHTKYEVLNYIYGIWHSYILSNLFLIKLSN